MRVRCRLIRSRLSGGRAAANAPSNFRRLKIFRSFLVLLCLPLFGLAAPKPRDEAAPPTAKELAQGFREELVLARPRAGRHDAAAQREAREGLQTRRKWDRFGGLRLLELAPGESVPAAIQRLLATGDYEFVEPDALVYPSAAPNDPRFTEQWSLFNRGADNGIAGADIKATTAWDVRTDASNVIVAVIDTGVRYSHPDIAANMWTHPGETAGNGRDDDGNAYVDDVYGINARTRSGDPNDDDGHGSHVAGIIGAVGNNGIGIAGVAWNVKIMALKFLPAPTPANPTGAGNTSDGITCIDYAIAKGAHIINASYGTAGGTLAQFSVGQRDAILRARAAGIIFVAAAGNDSANMDLIAAYPASHRLDNVLAVGNSGNRDDLGFQTNFGSGAVELFAPGSAILSLSDSPTNTYVLATGTSMAAPHVAGALALLKAQFPGDDYRQLINRVLRSVDPIPSLATRAQTGGRLNIARALASTDNRPFNDDFATRARLSGSNLAVRGSNRGATTESGEPAVAGQTSATSLWWEWTPTATGTVRVSTDGSEYDTMLGVFTGTSLASLAAVVGNDDDATKSTSRVEFTAQAGVTYHLVVAGKGGAAGLTLLDIGAIPPNDNFANAQSLDGRSVVVRAANAQATVESGEPRILTFTGGKSLWYRWTAPATGRIHIAAQSDGFDPMLAVYTGANVGALTLISANDNMPGGTATDAFVAIEATAGTTYFIQLDGKGSSGSPPPSAPFVLTLNDTLWQVAADNNITSAPAVAADGSLYVGSTGGTFYAFNADGTQRWSVNTGALIDTSAAAISSDGTVYFATSGTTGADAKLLAYRTANGTKKWEILVGTGSNANNAVSLDNEGTIYLHSDAGRLFAFSDRESNAELKWSTAVPGTSYASVSIAQDGTVYLGSDDTAGGHRFYAINPDNGSTKWTFTADNPIYTTAAIDASGNVYFGTLTSGRLYSLSPTGVQRWVYAGASLGTSSSPALSPDGNTVYFAGYDGKLHAVNTATGSARWVFTLGDEVRASSPAVDANGNVYIGCYDGLLYAVSSSGSLVRTWSTGDLIRSSPALANNNLYFGSNDKRLYAAAVGSAPSGPWPQYHHNARRTGRATNETLAIVSSPQSQVAPLGLSFTLRVTATGEGPLTYVWRLNGDIIAGASASTYTVSNVTPAAAGTYTVTVTGPQGSVTSLPAIVTVEQITPGRLTNLSVRTNAGTNAQTLIVGFTLAGNPAKDLLIRAVGPSLTPFGVAGTLADPRLQLFSGTNVLVTNDDWAIPPGGGSASAVSAAFAACGAFSLETAAKDAAMVRNLGAGVYTAQVTGSDGGSGIALAELYDVAPETGARLINVAARAQVGTGNAVLIAGFTISGNVPKQVLIRGIGPALSGLGVIGALANPRIDIFRGTSLVQGNDDWGGTAALTEAFVQVNAFALASASSRDAALLVSLPPGSYTAQLSGVGGTTGVGLIEVYEIP